ncbi:MAG: hypothetical protein M3279_09565, partial [Actinomycetota bacterium]|nr:hypothetical protein [Actinomycetota bacterium]
MPVEPGPRHTLFGGDRLDVASGPSEGGRFGAPPFDLRTLVRQGAALLLAAALVLVMLPSFSSSARASGLRLYLHNFPTPPSGNTPAGRALDMNAAAPTAATLYQYSTDHFNGRSGRYVHRSTTSGSAEADLLYMINWVYQVPQDVVLDGTATGGIWLSQKDGCAQTGQFHLWLRTKSDRMSDAGTLIGSGAGPVPPSGGSPPCGWGLVGVSMPVSATIPKGTWIELKLTVRDADRDAAMVAYDTTSFASYLDLPVGVATPTPEPPTPTPTPEPATPTPEPATPTPEPATPTPEPATPTPDPETPTPDPATPTPDPATPTPTAPPPTPTPTPDPPTPDPPTPDPPPPTPPPPTP